MLARCGGSDRPQLSAGAGTGTIDVGLSAGATIAGATITAYAISDATTGVNDTVGNAGAIGTGGPTDSAAAHVRVGEAPFSLGTTFRYLVNLKLANPGDCKLQQLIVPSKYAPS